MSIKKKIDNRIEEILNLLLQNKSKIAFISKNSKEVNISINEKTINKQEDDDLLINAIAKKFNNTNNKKANEFSFSHTINGVEKHFFYSYMNKPNYAYGVITYLY